MKEELIKILCEVEEVKKDLMELKFGTILKSPKTWKTVRYCWDSYIYWAKWKFAAEVKWKVSDKLRSTNEIIWNTLEERHLRIYCKAKNIMYMQSETGWWHLLSSIDYEDKEGVLFKLDNTKSLNDQSDEVIGVIVKFLESNK